MNQHSLAGARVGIDIGRVIMAATDPDGKADTSFLRGNDEQAMLTPPSEGAFDVIRDIVERTSGDVWLVSKCGVRIQKLTRRWLARWAFHEVTGVREDRVRFCLERRDKARHAEELRLTHFIDDRIDVHEHLRDLVRNLYLFGHQKPWDAVPPWVRQVLTWEDVRRELCLAQGAEGKSMNAGGT